MTKEQIDELEFLLEKRKEFQSFIDCDSSICRIKFDYSWGDEESLSWEKIKMVHAKDFAQEVVALAKIYLASIEKQIEDVLTEVK